MDTVFFYLSLFGFLAGHVHAEICTDWDRDDTYFHCDSCCGSWPYENCCESAVIGIVVGCILGGLFLIGVGVVIVCIFMKQKGRTGRVIQPAGVVQTPIYSTTVAYTAPYPQQGYPQQPAYPPPAYPPPAYPPNNQNLYAQPAPLPEGIQSHPPVDAGLPRNHRVV